MNKVTQERINHLLDTAQTQEHIFWGKELVVSYQLESGFTVTGRAACVDPANFNLAIGHQVAREDAENQMWVLEGYRLQLALAGYIVEAEELKEVQECLTKPGSHWEQGPYSEGHKAGQHYAADLISELLNEK